jgi:hypothetical protein
MILWAVLAGRQTIKPSAVLQTIFSIEMFKISSPAIIHTSFTVQLPATFVPRKMYWCL